MTAPSATVSYLRQHQLRPHLIVADAIAGEFARLDTLIAVGGNRFFAIATE